MNPAVSQPLAAQPRPTPTYRHVSLTNTDARPCDLATTGIKNLDEPRDGVAADHLEQTTTDPMVAPNVQETPTQTLTKCPQSVRSPCLMWAPNRWCVPRSLEVLGWLHPVTMSPNTPNPLTCGNPRHARPDWLFTSQQFALLPLPSHPLAVWTRYGDIRSALAVSLSRGEKESRSSGGNLSHPPLAVGATKPKVARTPARDRSVVPRFLSTHSRVSKNSRANQDPQWGHDR